MQVNVSARGDAVAVVLALPASPQQLQEQATEDAGWRKGSASGGPWARGGPFSERPLRSYSVLGAGDDEGAPVRTPYLDQPVGLPGPGGGLGPLPADRVYAWSYEGRRAYPSCRG